MSNISETFQRLSLTTTLGVALFNVATAIMLGIAGDIIALISSRPLLPALMSFLALALIFASSNTRNPDRYHAVEWTVVIASVVVMLGFALIPEVGGVVQSTAPVSEVLLFALFGTCSAIVAR